MRPLTPRQREVLVQIKLHLEQTGFPPTRAEIASSLGFRSVNAAEDHLKALARKHMIELCAGTSRGIRLLPEAEDELQRSQGGLRPAGSGAPPRGARASYAGGAMPAGDGNSLSLPLIGRVAAGRPILADGHIESTFALDRNLFERRPDYLLRIRGESMRDAGLLDGDLLAVQASREAHNGQIVVARLGNEVTVKRFRHESSGACIELLPENPAFEPIIVPPGSEDFCIEGIGVGLIRQHGSRR